MDKATLKALVNGAIDARSAEIIDLGRHLWTGPEVGFKEAETAAKVAEVFSTLGLACREGLALTGVRTELDSARMGPTIAVLGELDAVVCHEHPAATPETGAIHGCGHNAQLAAMVGVAMGLVDTKAIEHLSGRVVFFAVPAEEYVEIEYRNNLRQDGKIEFMGGKPELVRLGEFDDIDAAMLVHSAEESAGRSFVVGGSMNGFLAKMVRFEGRAAHAGARPEAGVNALNAAALAVMAIHAQRETFREEDCIRVHFIMTKGGDLVNVVPDDVRLEMFVRARTLDAIMEAAGKVDCALQGAAMAAGAEVHIEDVPGYLPQIEDESLLDLFCSNAKALLGSDGVRPGSHVSGSTDMGDLSHLMPVIQPEGGGFSGQHHGSDFEVADEEMAYVMPAKAMAMTVIDLLYGDAEMGSRLVGEFEPRLTKEQYLTYLREGSLPEDTASEEGSKELT